MINFADLQPGTYKRLGEDSYFLLEKDTCLPDNLPLPHTSHILLIILPPNLIFYA